MLLHGTPVLIRFKCEKVQLSKYSNYKQKKNYILFLNREIALVQNSIIQYFYLMKMEYERASDTPQCINF